MLKRLSGHAFGKAYADHEVAYHDTEEIAVMLPRTKYFKVMGIPIS
jgi:hypothetical protein